MVRRGDYRGENAVENNGSAESQCCAFGYNVTSWQHHTCNCFRIFVFHAQRKSSFLFLKKSPLIFY